MARSPELLEELISSEFPHLPVSRFEANVRQNEGLLIGDTQSLHGEMLDYGTLICDITDEFNDIFRFVSGEDVILASEIQKCIIPVITELSDYNYVSTLLGYIKDHDDYLVRNSLAVGVISTFIGRRLGLTFDELHELTIAATLHDVGKLYIPKSILTKPGALTESEFVKVKEHTVLGYRILKGSPCFTHRQALVALQHHERTSGSGYPYRTPAAEISPFAKIVAVADVFHAMSSTRPYSESIPLLTVIEELSDVKGNKYEPAITSMFTSNAETLS